MVEVGNKWRHDARMTYAAYLYGQSCDISQLQVSTSPSVSTGHKSYLPLNYVGIDTALQLL